MKSGSVSTDRDKHSAWSVFLVMDNFAREDHTTAFCHWASGTLLAKERKFFKVRESVSLCKVDALSF